MSEEELAKLLLDAVMNGNWFLLASAGLFLAVKLFQKLAGQKIPFLKTNMGEILVVFVVSVLSGVLNAAVAGSPFSAAVLLTALKVALPALSPLVLRALKSYLGGFNSDEAKKAAEADGKKAAETAQTASPEDLVNK